ncbi:sugar kinase [Aureimonas pseudogalii]|uniref:2-dehydro-3-deoxygluconokinase n=1 Tax=Aureimonas pseudogalii TaxID=1744844 RepID=A0A7W6H5I4_9HYPH|nr:sugar kinase [Aureimonas pseudogalii]MBB3998945.1 2-dehydro-3-deoxygluconokinase [Aureimonas pseudogalii]
MSAGQRIAFVGECMIELFHRPGDEAGTLRRTVGGDTLNAAVYCRRALGETAGVAVHYVTRIGDDPFGAEIPAFIAAEGVETDLVTVAPGETTGLYAISRDASGERSFAYWRSAAAARRLFAEGLDADLERTLEGFDALCFSGITLAILSPIGRTRLLDLARRMKAAGRIVAFDGNYRPRLWVSKEEAKAAIAEAHASASLSLPGLDDEQALFADVDARSATTRLLAMGASAAIVKSGGDPAMVSDAAGLREIAGVPAPRIVDTTSAGDSFNGAALAVLLTGGTLDEAARAGHRMASLVIGEYGAIVPRGATVWPEGPRTGL